MTRRGEVFLLGVTAPGTHPAEIKNNSPRSDSVILTDYAVSSPRVFLCPPCGARR